MRPEIRIKLEERLREVGLKLTPQRFAVMDYLAHCREHPTAEQVRADLNRRFPRASRATIYNTLNALRDAGLVHEVYLDDRVARYDANIERHHHFICRACDRLEDISPEAVGALPRSRLARGYRVEHYDIVLRGLCSKCAATKTN